MVEIMKKGTGTSNICFSVTKQNQEIYFVSDVLPVQV